MRSHRNHSALCAALAFVLMLAHGPANAGDLPPQVHRWVGVGPGCGYTSIQTAIDASGFGDVIHITRTQSYTATSLLIQDKGLTLQGGHATCGAGIAGSTPLSAASLPGFGSVLTIRGGSHVTLRNVGLFFGQAESRGGGIQFDGTGTLRLFDTSVAFNEASTGGGIAMIENGGSLQLELGANVIVAYNAAQTGGGVFLSGRTRLIARSTGLSINNNGANAAGGGVAVTAGARAEIGATGIDGDGAIADNAAGRGGGIAVYGARSGNVASVLHLFSTSASRPLTLERNSASEVGGALWIGQAEVDPGGAGVLACARDVRIDNNTAPDGAAIYLGRPPGSAPIGNFVGGRLFFNAAAAPCAPQDAAALGAVACAEGVRCNTIAGNRSEAADGTPAAGATIALTFADSLVATRMALRDNSGGVLLRLDGRSATAELDTCLVADNTVDGELLRAASAESGAILRGCTVAGNSIGAAQLFATAGALTLLDTILDAPGRAAVLPLSPTAIVNAANILARDLGGLPASPNIVQSTPAFLDATRGDYRLAAGGIAIDFAPDGAAGIDLDGRPRPLDAPQANRFGARDLGAYEWSPAPPPGTLLRDGFEP